MTSRYLRRVDSARCHEPERVLFKISLRYEAVVDSYRRKKGQKERRNAFRARTSRCVSFRARSRAGLRVGCSGRVEGDRECGRGTLGSSPPERIQPVSVSPSRGPGRSRSIQQEMIGDLRRWLARGEKCRRLAGWSTRSAVQDRIIAPDIQPGWRRFAR
jgi:hypothetical protein